MANNTMSNTTVVIHKDKIEVIMSRTVRIKFSRSDTTSINTMFSILPDNENTYDAERFERLAKYHKNELDRLEHNHEQGKNTRYCCVDAYHTRGFRHHSKCVNWVTVF